MTAHADEDEEEEWEGNLYSHPENQCVGSPGRWESIHLIMMQDYHFWTYILRVLLPITETLPQPGSFLFYLNSQELGTAYVSPNRRIKKMQCICTMAYYSAEITSWNVQTNRQNQKKLSSVVSLMQKDKYGIKLFIDGY